MTRTYRWIIKSARTAHLYLTLFCLVLLAFFSVTGFMLNHESWFLDLDAEPRRAESKFPEKWLAEPDKLTIVEWLRKEHGAAGQMDFFETTDDEMRIRFSRAGRRFEAVVDRKEGTLATLDDRRGIFGIAFDMHRGKSTGSVWGILMDALCFAVLFISITGLVMWSSLKGRGKHGRLVMFLGALTMGVVYFVFMP